MTRSQHTVRVAHFVQPMAARVVDKLPEGNDWMYEVTFDGQRALRLKDGGKVTRGGAGGMNAWREGL